MSDTLTLRRSPSAIALDGLEPTVEVPCQPVMLPALVAVAAEAGVALVVNQGAAGDGQWDWPGDWRVSKRTTGAAFPRFRDTPEAAELAALELIEEQGGAARLRAVVDRTRARLGGAQ